MKLYLYANYNALAGFFGPMMSERIEPDEIVKDYTQIICGLEQEQLKSLSECDLYCLGTIDNVTGEILPEKTFLLHCGEVASRFIKSEEVKEGDKNEG